MSGVTISFDEIARISNDLGLYLNSALDFNKADSSLKKNKSRLKLWQDNSFAADMGYMYRDPELFTNLTNFLPEVKSLLTFLVPYAVPQTQDPSCPAGFGRVARYARGYDYHLVLKELLNILVDRISENFKINKKTIRVFTDAVPLLERTLGESSGFGFQGKSTMLIRPKLGTYTFLAEVLLPFEVLEIPESKEFKSSCGTCSNCINDCPTGAIVSPFKLDAKKCISYLTIEKRSYHTLEESRMIQDWVFGCDICQEVCPFNHHGNEVEPYEDFKPEKGVGALLDLREVISIRTNADFKKRFNKTALLRAKREGLIRNALSVLRNQKASKFYPEVFDCINYDDSDMVRSQAKQTLLGFKEIESGIVAERITRFLN